MAISATMGFTRHRVEPARDSQHTVDVVSPPFQGPCSFPFLLVSLAIANHSQTIATRRDRPSPFKILDGFTPQRTVTITTSGSSPTVGGLSRPALRLAIAAPLVIGHSNNCNHYEYCLHESHRHIWAHPFHRDLWHRRWPRPPVRRVHARVPAPVPILP